MSVAAKIIGPWKASLRRAFLGGTETDQEEELDALIHSVSLNSSYNRWV